MELSVFRTTKGLNSAQTPILSAPEYKENETHFFLPVYKVNLTVMEIATIASGNTSDVSISLGANLEILIHHNSNYSFLF